ncbi:MAG: DUF4097 domain-containing protein [Paludibacteraceae bacterium]|nr:DUF4097 domain-containing protein [Paludibacteraceae bacterium]
MNEKQRFILLLFCLLLVLIVVAFINGDKLWNRLEYAVAPYVQYDKEAFCQATNSGSADAKAIHNLHISWERGDVVIRYAPQERITWTETFVEGEPTQYNTQYYWMNSHTVYIEFRNQEYYTVEQQARQQIRKNLLVKIPQGQVLDEIVVHNESGNVSCVVQAKQKDIR